jgi:hypothetical protein
VHLGLLGPDLWSGAVLVAKARHVALLESFPHHRKIKGSKIQYRVMADSSDHILCNVYMKKIKLRGLSIHWFYSCQNTLVSGTYCLSFDWRHWLSFHCRIRCFKTHIAWKASYINKEMYVFIFYFSSPLGCFSNLHGSKNNNNCIFQDTSCLTC